MEKLINKENIVIGISACLIGEKVRFDASNKPSNFCINELGQHVTYKAYCPEVAIGMPIPRPTIRQIKKDDVIHVSRPDGSGDVTEALQAYGKKIAALSSNLSGYVFCAKSPSCGMERVKVYSPEGNPLVATGVGVFAQEIMKANPLLPCEENGRLNDPIIRENFVARVFAYRHWQILVEEGITKHKLMTFHSHYKYMVMSHDLVAYKNLGRLLARADLAVEEMASQYISGLMAALKIKATRKKHANTLYHMIGYFSDHLTPEQRQELCQQVEGYRNGLMPLVVPLTLINHYLMIHPKSYLAKQVYLNPYPQQLKLRYSY
ncbi:YbgA family protein [Thalassotalea sp. PLHSN55]|uniref:YbgA family protein n=1 Tax=Thalassotalea sp. PLHSN55 TaxID=3435888 RepID=UPI003F849FA0